MAVFYQSMHNLKLEGDGSSAPRSGHFTTRKDPLTIVQGADWVSWLVWWQWRSHPPPGFI